MSETLRDLVVSLSLQTDNFTRNIRSVQKQIAEAESQFRLAAAGVPQERIDAVATPIGLAIGAVTPSEIALAITAQLVRRRAERRGEGPGKGERA